MKLSIKGQGHSLTLVKGHSEFKVKCLTFGLFTEVSNSGPHGPLVLDVNVLLLKNTYKIVACKLDSQSQLFADLNTSAIFKFLLTHA